jgi:hypothetical protein
MQPLDFNLFSGESFLLLSLLSSELFADKPQDTFRATHDVGACNGAQQVREEAQQLSRDFLGKIRC